MGASKITFIGFLLVLWAAISAMLGENGIAAICLISGAITFLAGFMQLTNRPKSAAEWLARYF